MDDTKFRHADRQLLVTSVTRIEDHAVPGTIHRLEGPFLLFDVKDEHVVFVVLPVAGGHPELGIVHIGGYNFFRAFVSSILSAYYKENFNYRPSW